MNLALKNKILSQVKKIWNVQLTPNHGQAIIVFDDGDDNMHEIKTSIGELLTLYKDMYKNTEPNTIIISSMIDRIYGAIMAEIQDDILNINTSFLSLYNEIYEFDIPFREEQLKNVVITLANNFEACEYFCEHVSDSFLQALEEDASAGYYLELFFDLIDDDELTIAKWDTFMTICASKYDNLNEIENDMFIISEILSYNMRKHYE